MSEAKVPCNYQPRHDTLKEILEELGKLYNTTSTRHKVFLQLRDGLEPYCGNGYLEAFYKNLVEGSDHRLGVSSYGSGSILLLTQAAERIGRELLQRPSWDGHLDNTHKDHEDCGEKYSKALKACLPKTFAALFFLFFNVSKDCTSFGGGSWNSSRVNDSRNIFYKWLTDEPHYGKMPELIARGFPGVSLTSQTAQDVVEPLKKAVSLKPNTNEGALQKVLCGFMFVCEWHDALTGHACLFLSTFCSKVIGGSEDLLQKPYKEHSEAFKEVCRGLQSSLEPFIDGSSGLSAVCHDNTNLFDNLWDDKYFDDYVKWLKENLHYIIGSLKAMFLEPPGWSLSTIQSASSAGPFKYGFVFNGSWEASTSGSKLQTDISKLTGEDSGSLQNFKSFLFNPSTPSSAAATAGGVFTGLFGLGGAGAGAAYATNAFGLKDIITGLISSFLK
ncbi:hypothetical protein X943_002964 [Babesia divergens]|uniref:Uncharacterized protein n=1 Tax=Babesia divergens TaxID=32595 RepID=A0AAD9GBQ6_BABDI|nr:hypothetical protein X943_002964 [Babesia divergens]